MHVCAPVLDNIIAVVRLFLVVAATLLPSGVVPLFLVLDLGVAAIKQHYHHHHKQQQSHHHHHNHNNNNSDFLFAAIY